MVAANAPAVLNTYGALIKQITCNLDHVFSILRVVSSAQK